MSYKRRLKRLEKQSIDKTEKMYVLWKDDADTFRDEARDKIYTIKELEKLRDNPKNSFLIAKWVGTDDV